MYLGLLKQAMERIGIVLFFAVVILIFLAPTLILWYNDIHAPGLHTAGLGLWATFIVWFMTGGEKDEDCRK